LDILIKPNQTPNKTRKKERNPKQPDLFFFFHKSTNKRKVSITTKMHFTNVLFISVFAALLSVIRTQAMPTPDGRRGRNPNRNIGLGLGLGLGAGYIGGNYYNGLYGGYGNGLVGGYGPGYPGGYPGAYSNGYGAGLGYPGAPVYAVPGAGVSQPCFLLPLALSIHLVFTPN
jgi:hypothetical protein